MGGVAEKRTVAERGKGSTEVEKTQKNRRYKNTIETGIERWEKEKYKSRQDTE